jgi:uncharacterized protein (DUF1697 family)
MTGKTKTFVALMCGVNVGAARKMPMADLRALCIKLGFENPETFIQSGNLIVDAAGSADDLRKALEKAAAARFGFAVDVVVRPAVAWKRYVAANPFAGDAKAQPKMVHLYLSCAALKPGATKALEQRAQSG